MNLSVFNDYVGQRQILDQLLPELQAADIEGRPVRHMVLYSVPGLGKDYLVNVVIKALGAEKNFVQILGSDIAKAGKRWDWGPVFDRLDPQVLIDPTKVGLDGNGFAIGPWHPRVLFLNECEAAPRAAVEIIHSALQPGPDEASDMMMMGQALEPYIVQRTALELDVETTRANKRRVHPAAPMQATIDAFIVGRREFIEAKLTHPMAFKRGTQNPEDRWGDPYTDQVPRYYLVQVQHGLHVLTVSTGEPWDVGWLGLMVGVEEFRLYRIQRNPQLGAMIEQAASDFWNNHVIPRIPPTDEGPSMEMLSRLPRTAATIEFQRDMDPALIPAYESAADDVKAAEGRKEEAKKAIVRALGQFEVGYDQAGRRVGYPLINSTKFDRKAAEVAYPDIIKRFTTQTSHRRLTL